MQQSKRYRLYISFILVLLVLLLYGFSRRGEDQIMNPVVGLPLGHSPIIKNLASYNGPHPSQLPRPNDPARFPIALGETGPIQPLFAGPVHYPFLCRTEKSDLGQPLVDNQDGAGMRVFELSDDGRKTDVISGYSKDCSLETKARYLYKRVGTNSFFPLKEAKNDVERISFNGQEIDFVVRVETGTINRFIYVIAALRGSEETLAKPSSTHWNGRLIYQFRGGVGIGRRQGRVKPAFIPIRRQRELARGYAVAYSSGNQTSNHYDPLLAEDTAIRVKRQFTALYGEPTYTVGIGGSGGAIQQYLIAQNNPGVLDALIPLYSYPDMVTQTSYGLDCELLEHYFDITDGDNPRWKTWSQRRLVEGLNARDDLPNTTAKIYALAKLANFEWPGWSDGLTECVNGWRGAAPLVNNPRYVHFSDRFVQEIHPLVNWSYWDNLKHAYGTDDAGFARRTFDNVGVQYGLSALLGKELSVDEFLKLNAEIGSWKYPGDMGAERFWRKTGARSDLEDTSPWGHHNMRLSHGDAPAPRSHGDLAAIGAAFRSGQVFLGKIDLPIIDLRHYLEPDLDMHHMIASFSIRKRMQQLKGNAKNQVIWVANKEHTPVPAAFTVIDEWMANIRQNPDKRVTDNKPSLAVDSCFDQDGAIIASGDRVWDGAWNNRSVGDCTKIYPSFSTSRMVAGEDVTGHTFKCALQTVDSAISINSVYGDIDMAPYLARLREVFPEGVCDYQQLDPGQPDFHSLLGE